MTDKPVLPSTSAAILANTSTVIALKPPADRAMTWVRFENGRFLPVDTATGKFIVLIDASADERDDVNPDGMWHLSMVLSYALCGDESAFEAALDEVAYTTAHRCLGNNIYRVEATFPGWESRDQLDWCELYTLEQVHALDSVQLADGLGVSLNELPQLLGSVGNDYGEECVIELATGREIRCPVYPKECSYVRITLPGIVPLELAYWSSDEWGEAPAEVMGAILGAARRSA